MARLAHVMIAKVAKGIAGAFYEEAARDDLFYRLWPNQRNFIRKNWQHFIPPAKQSLVKMLGDPKWPESVKEEIFEALALDLTLPTGSDTRVTPARRQLLH